MSLNGHFELMMIDSQVHLTRTLAGHHVEDIASKNEPVEQPQTMVNQANKSSLQCKYIFAMVSRGARILVVYFRTEKGRKGTHQIHAGLQDV